MAGKQGESRYVTVRTVKHDVSSDRTLCETLASALAEVEDVDPMELAPLYEAVDVELLERLLFPGRSSGLSAGVVGFTTHGWTVFVRADGRVRICDTTRGSGSSSATTIELE